ncbi:MAG: sugar-binding transcriptional regulator [Rhizobiaceae bacterium]|nr:sugar-binding transcriptional regulator [Rhizobiaceae bacterium]
MSIRLADQIIHKAAWLYYAHGLRQDEVARALNISRASVATYLRRARETGIVTISTSTQLFAEDGLARRLEDALRLDSVWVVPTAGDAAMASDVPVVAANVFLGLIDRGARIGVAWGQTVYTIADLMAHADLQDVTVVQLCGNLGAPYSYRPDECTMEIARRLNAKGLNFYAPLVLSTEQLAAALRAEPVIRDQLDGIASCDIALFSVGTTGPGSHIVRCGAIDRSELDALRRVGGVCVIAGRVIDASGQAVDCSYNRRLISADLDAIRAISKRLVVVQDADKFEALKAAIRGGFCTHLVVDADMARRLLDDTTLKTSRN